jgi:4-diphosphocytidyl-2-C-methyl-D-erythritol kinase
LPFFPAWAKLNLGLEVGARRPDGYHEIRSIMQTVSLADQVKLEWTTGGISLEVEGADLPADSGNIAMRAAKLMRDRAGGGLGVSIRLIKRIPLAAGLAGGSADAAAVLFGLNRLWDLGLSGPDLIALAADLGSDVPFCLLGGTAYAKGRGEIVAPLPPLPPCFIVLVCPPLVVSTAWAYSMLDRDGLEQHRPVDGIDGLEAALETGNLSQIAAGMANTFEPVVMAHFPLIGEIKEMLLTAGALAAMMSGSGPTVYGLFSTSKEAHAAASILKASFITHVVQPVPVGAGRLIEE